MDFWRKNLELGS